MIKTPDYTHHRILITGGSGFIGTNAVEYYLLSKAKVLNLDMRPPRNRLHEPFYREVNILDLISLEKAILEFDPTEVLHLAARTDLDEKNDLAGYTANVRGVANVIEVLNKCHNLRRVIFASSMYVCYPGYNPQNFNDYAPHTVYGESKVLTEKIIKASNITNFEWTIIRPTSIWGPWFGEPYKDFFNRVLSRTYFKIKGKVSTKTFGFVYNSLNQIDCLLFIHKEKVQGETFYIGDSPGLNINHWADEIALQLSIRIPEVPLSIIKMGGWIGDFLSLFGVKFPLQSFRVKNMLTDNVITLLDKTTALVSEQPYALKDGVGITLDWLKKAAK
jgi:GlcNAc-P-P-Und epimerase